jgi:hypothetical protein
MTELNVCIWQARGELTSLFTRLLLTAIVMAIFVTSSTRTTNSNFFQSISQGSHNEDLHSSLDVALM